MIPAIANLGFNIQTNAVESGNVVKAQYPCFGSNFAARGAHMDTRHKIYLGDTDKDGSSTKDNTDTNGSYLVYNDTETLGINLFGTRCHDGGSTTSYLESFEFVITMDKRILAVIILIIAVLLFITKRKKDNKKKIN